MISPGGLVATFFKAATQVSAAVDAAFNYVSLLLNGEPATGTSTFLSDASSNKFAATPVGGARPDNFSPFQGDGNYSVQFNGTTDYFTMPYSAPLGLSGDFTVEGWLYLTSAPADYQMIMSGSETSVTYVTMRASVIEVQFGGNAATIATFPHNMTANQWFHFAVVRSGGTVTGYINGVSKPVTQAAQAGTLFNQGSSSVVYVGRWSTASYYFPGYISNLRVVKGTAVYTGNFTVPTSPLTAISGTSLLTCQSSRFVDNSANAFAITATGTPKVSYNQPIGSKLGSVYFDGVSAASFPASANLNLTGDFTIELWVNPKYSAFPTYAGLAGASTQSAANWDLMLFNGHVRFEAAGTTAINLYNASTTPAPLNTWSHIAVTRAGNVFTVWVNGVQDSTVTTATTINTNALATFVGHTGDTLNVNRMVGAVSNFRIVRGAALYSSTFTPSTSPLTAVSGTALLTCQGNIVDASTNAFVATLTSTPSASYSSPFPQTVSLPSTYGSARFNGTTDGITYTGAIAPQGTENFTIEFWAYKNSAWTTANKVFFDNAGTGAQVQIWLAQTAGMLRFAVAGGAAILDYNYTNFAANQWYHLAYTRVGNVFTLYVNGTSVATATYGAVWGTSTTSTLGVGSAGNAYYFDGYISNFRVVRGTAVYTGNFTPPTAPLTAVAGTSLLALQSPTPANAKGFIDYSQQNNVITAAGTPAQGTFSPFSQSGWSVSFNGTTDYLNTPFASSLVVDSTTPFTLEAWVNLTSSANGDIFCMRDGAGATAGWEFAIISQVPSFGWDGSGRSNFVGTSAIPLNTWTHVAVTYDGTTLRYFKNGVQEVSMTSIVTSTSTSALLYIGVAKYSGTTTRYFSGSISNARIVKGTAVYTANFTPSATPLTAIANTSLLALQSNRFKDSSSNAFAVTVSGTPVVQATSPFEPTAPWSAATNGSSIRLDYTNSPSEWLTMPSSSAFAYGTGDFTVEAWVYLTATAPSQSPLVFGQSVAGNNYFTLFINYTNFVVQFIGNNSASIFGPSTSVKLNAWHHVAVARCNGVVTAYLDGVPGTPTAHTTDYTNTTYAPSIGRYSHTTSQWLPGYVCDVRVVNGTAVYTKAFTPPTAPLQPVPGTVLLAKGTPGVVDATGKNDIVTVGATGVTTANKKYGTGAIQLSPTAAQSDYLITYTSALDVGASDWTLEMWVYPTLAYGTYNFLLNKAAGGTNATTDIELFINSSGQISHTWYTGATGVGLTTTGTVPLNTWTHIAIVRNGGLSKAYINGTADSATSNNTGALNNTTNKLYIGNQYVGGRGFVGLIDDLRVTKGAARYTANFIPPTAAYPTN